ncbi:MAG: ATP-binding cassette domain-containing protein [Myxococcota bacterium]
MPAMIEVSGLSRRYGRFDALKDVSFSVDAGEIVGFLGPNGAGKTTTMKILTGFISPTAGGARVAGFDVVTESLEVRRRIGYLPEAAPVYAEMRVLDYLDFVGRVRGMPQAERVTAIERAAAECDIVDRLHQAVGTLSKGYRQRVGLAQALLHQPPILILDEPTSGLDPNQILAVRNLIRRIGQNRTVILSTHILQEVQATCDRVLILNRGQIVADAPTAEIQSRHAGGTLTKVAYAPGTVRLTDAQLRARIEQVPGVQRVSPQAEEDGALAYEVLADRDVRPGLFALAVDAGLVLTELAKERSTLEEVFRRLTTGDDPREDAHHHDGGGGDRPGGDAAP